MRKLYFNQLLFKQLLSDGQHENDHRQVTEISLSAAGEQDNNLPYNTY